MGGIVEDEDEKMFRDGCPDCPYIEFGARA
jgi:hypothetical protein